MIRPTDEMVPYLKEISCTASSNAERARMFNARFGRHYTASDVTYLCRKNGIPDCNGYMDSIMSDESKRWVMDNYMNFDTLASMTREYNKIFPKKTYSNMSIFLKNNGITDYYTKIKFTKEQIDWITEHANCGTFIELTDDFNERFSQSLTPKNFIERCRRINIPVANDRNAVLKAVGKRNEAPIGHVSVIGGYKRIKIANGSGNTIPLSHYIYEQATGEKIPKGSKIVYCDGDPNNLSMENMEVVSNRIMGKLIGTQKSKDPNVRKTWAKLYKLEEMLDDN